MGKVDIGGNKLFDFLKANYEVPDCVINFEISCGVDKITTVKWECGLIEKTENITEPLKDLTEPTEQ